MSRKTATAWKPGQSGNPKGRPKGSRNAATLLAIAAMEGELDAVVRKIIEAAKGGDMTAARLIVDKLVPAVKERTLMIDIPQVVDMASCLQAQAGVLNSVSTGEIQPGEGQILSGLIENQRRVIETQHLEIRIKAIEERVMK